MDCNYYHYYSVKKTNIQAHTHTHTITNYCAPGYLYNELFGITTKVRQNRVPDT